jgi:4-hydroxybenzoate polyprenyltransferase
LPNLLTVLWTTLCDHASSLWIRGAERWTELWKVTTCDLRSRAVATGRRTTVGLVLACHPLPCIAVTAFAAGYAATSGLQTATVAGVAAAILSGQLCVGWANDWIDADRDTAAGRTDKPIPGGLVGRGAVGVACLVAAAACVWLSLRLGARPGIIHLAAVASALSYDAGLKSGPASPLPYAFSFGALPVVVTTAGPGGPWPPPGVMAASALLGVAAHFANTVPDTAADAATGVRGLPQRAGPRLSLAITGTLVCLAAVLLLASAPHVGPAAVVLLGGGAVLAALGVPISARSDPRRAFPLTLLAVGLVVAGFLTSA